MRCGIIGHKGNEWKGLVSDMLIHGICKEKKINAYEKTFVVWNQYLNIVRKIQKVYIYIYSSFFGICQNSALYVWP